MQKFSVTILGSNSALPASGRNPTAQLLNANNAYYLIDCGEGTQMQFRRFRLKMQRINAIFISHLHGDHYFGLLGLLNSLHLLGRIQPMTLVCPKTLKSIIDIQMKAAGGILQYKINYIFTDEIHSLNQKRIIYQDKNLTAEAFPLKHRIACTGFIFSETRGEYKYDPQKGKELNVKVQEIPTLKSGQNIVRDDGTIIPFAQVTIPPETPRSYAFCTDTRPLDTTADFAKNVDVMYHEATFLKSEKSRAKQTFHSTADDAAKVAKNANAGKLLIGHFSARYSTLDLILEQAREVFSNTDLAIEGKEFEIKLKKAHY